MLEISENKVHLVCIGHVSVMREAAAVGLGIKVRCGWQGRVLSEISSRGSSYVSGFPAIYER